MINFQKSITTGILVYKVWWISSFQKYWCNPIWNDREKYSSYISKTIAIKCNLKVADCLNGILNLSYSTYGPLLKSDNKIPCIHKESVTDQKWSDSYYSSWDRFKMKCTAEKVNHSFFLKPKYFWYHKNSYTISKRYLGTKNGSPHDFDSRFCFLNVLVYWNNRLFCHIFHSLG